MLKHLIVVPEQGLANRIRAVASAERLCSLYGARLTVVWKGYSALFAATPGVEYVSEAPECRDAIVIRHMRKRDGGAWRNRVVSAREHERILLYSGYTFGDGRGIFPVFEHDIAPWLPRPSDALRGAVTAFAERNSLAHAIGFHVRSTDNAAALRLSPVSAFADEAKRLPQETPIFLATDSFENEKALRERCGERIASYPKSLESGDRWPRVRERATEDLSDAADLFLLARTDHIVGSAASSFTRLAMLYSGSPKSRIVCRGWSLEAWKERLRGFLLRRSIMKRR